MRRGNSNLNQNISNFHSKDIETILENLKTTLNGLSSEEAEQRLKVYGKNIIEEGKKKSLFVLFLEQFKNVMVLLQSYQSFLARQQML